MHVILHKDGVSFSSQIDRRLKGEANLQRRKSFKLFLVLMQVHQAAWFGHSPPGGHSKKTFCFLFSRALGARAFKHEKFFDAS